MTPAERRTACIKFLAEIDQAIAELKAEYHLLGNVMKNGDQTQRTDPQNDRHLINLALGLFADGRVPFSYTEASRLLGVSKQIHERCVADYHARLDAWRAEGAGMAALAALGEDVDFDLSVPRYGEHGAI